MNKAAFLFCLLLGMACAASAGAAELGRLFFTPAQRADMDRKRLLNPKELATEQPAPRRTVNGRIIRSDGKTTTWVNGIPDDDAYSRRAKVGQTLDAGTGEAQDSLQGGRLVVKPAP
jgi:hypothetical protein